MRLLLNFFGFIVLSAILFSCRKEMSAENNIAPIVIDAAWEFTENSITYKGDIDTAYLADQPGMQMLTMEGTSTDGKSGSIVLQVIDDQLTAGNYVSPEIYFQYSENGTVLFENISLNPAFTLSITYIDSVSISGTFSGTVKDNQGVERTVTNGKFTAAIEGLAADQEPEPEKDYFPLQKSFTYQDGGDPVPDQLTITATGTEEIDGKTYTVFENSKTMQKKFYRKEGNDYYEYVTFNFGIPVTDPPTIDFLMLKDNAAEGDSWDTEPYVAHVSGMTVTFKIKNTVVSKGVPFQINGIAYDDVIEVATEIYTMDNTGEFINAVELGYTTLYAQGVGIIFYQERSDKSTWALTSYSKE